MHRLKCLPCIIDRKMAEQNGEVQPLDPVDVDDLNDAVTLLNGVPHCYEHIQVQRQSALMLPGMPGTATPQH